MAVAGSAPVTVLDVVDDLIADLTPERADRLSKVELSRLAEAVNGFYDSWTLPTPDSGEFRLYSGGWVAGNADGPEARQYLYNTLVYAPSVVIHDPIAEWFDPGRDRLHSPPPIRGASGAQVQGAEPQLLRADGYFAFRDEPERSRSFLANAMALLNELEPLIRAGIVLPIPQWRLVREQEQSILSAVRHDSKDQSLARVIGAAGESPPRTDHIRGMEVAPPGGVASTDATRAVVQNPSYFLNKTLALAAATASSYVPPASIDAALLDYRVAELTAELRQRAIDLQVISALGVNDLPFLGDLDARTLIAIRRDDQALADWRAELRTVARLIRASPSEGTAFVDEARSALGDVLLPKAKQVERAVSRSRVMKDAAKDQVATVTIGTAAASGGALIAGAAVAPPRSIRRCRSGFDSRSSGLSPVRVFALGALSGLVVIGDRHRRL